MSLASAAGSASHHGDQSFDSFDELIRHNRTLAAPSTKAPVFHRRGSSGGQTIRPEYEVAAGALSENGSDLEGSTATIRPGPRAGTAITSTSRLHGEGETATGSADLNPSKVSIGRPRDEARWNGFHLWRAESYQRRVSLQQQREDEDRERRQPKWFDKRRSVRRWFAQFLPINTGGTEEAEELRTSRMIVLTLVQAGAQVAWCLEFGYGTPYLLSIGLSKSATSLVWLAAPISGLVVQPAIGVMSDLSTSNWRRRQFIIASSALLAWATLVLAYSMPLASAIVDILHVGVADWDPIRVHARDDIKRLLAIIAFVSLDVSINGLQVSARALVLDVTPSSMHSRANAWSSRMMHAGNVFGYAAGWLDLGSASWLAWLGDGQLRKYAMVSLVAILLGSTVTCLGIEEAGVNDAGADDATIGGAADNEGEIDPTFSAAASVRPDLDAPLTFSQHCYGALMHIWQTLRRLPRSVRRICLVQLFANMAWFPFLFYATQWVIEVWQAEHRDAPPPADHANDDDERERLGSYALLLFALVSLAAATVLPYLALANWTSSSTHSHNPETETLLPSSRNGSVSSTKSEQPPRWRLSLRTIWTCAMTLLCLQMGLLTFLVDTYDHAVALVASIGVPFAVALWVPYALVMESVREAQDGMSPFEFEGDWFSPERVRGRRQMQRDTHGFQRSAAPSPMSIGRGNAARAVQDCGPLRGPAGPDQTAYQHSIVSRGCRVVSSNVRAVSPSPSRHGGQTGIRHGNDKDDVGATILGIHNMAIVLPMIVVAIVSSLILRAPRSSTVANGSTEQDGVGVVWILRLGGLAALCAAFLTRLVPLSRSERLLLGDPATLRQLRSVDDEDDEEDDED